ncbi:Sister chromatid cohesion protein PDS5-like B-B [Quillaja saponaria]|uniref:Sister chromatid cohesion protein PDS5-like B-B n=1 Tax=Quillaja saponaria TaxID=32244 RepID=A0AAD7PEM1_QUISA|nr:Sister chromatid cohesion protein PDS5-like B-B [Quillaja saponaria]
MSSSEKELEEQLKDAGNILLNPPSSIDQLLSLLDKLENLLANVEQAPPRSMQEALLPLMKALVSTELFKHLDENVKISVASCITEITRITAPDAPYDDEQMKEIFQLTVSAFRKLSHVSSRCYAKAVSILDTIARIRSCLVMLDLECDELVIEMFQHFLISIRPNHPHAVFLAMETIMTTVLDESEEISSELLRPLLDSVRKENQTISPISWNLGEKVITNCAAKLKPYLMEAVQSTGKALDDYAPIVTSICQNGAEIPQHDHLNDTREKRVQPDKNELDVKKDANKRSKDVEKLVHDNDYPTDVSLVMDDISKLKNDDGNAPTRNHENIGKESLKKQRTHQNKNSKSNDTGGYSEPDNSEPLKEGKAEIEPDSIPKKRGWKPNSLMNPEEGYDHFWISSGRNITKRKKSNEKEIDCLPSENPVAKKDTLPSKVEKVSEVLVSQPKIDEITDVASPVMNHTLPEESHPKRGRSKNLSSTGNQGAGLNSVLASKEDSLNALPKSHAPEPAGVSSKKDSEDTNNFELKPQKPSRKIGLASKSDNKVTLDAGLVVSEMDEVLSDAEKKSKSLMNVDTMNRDRGRCLVQLDVKRRRRSSVSITKDLASVSKIVTECSTISLKSDESCFVETPKTKRKRKPANGKEEGNGSCFEETPKTKSKRKPTTGKEEASATAEPVEQLVGSKIKVWWPMDKTFYEGVIYSYDPVKKKHKVLYADGDDEMLNLKKQCWELIGDDASTNADPELDIPKPEPASDMLQKGKGKPKSASAKKANATSSKRNGASTSSFKVESLKSSGKPVTAKKSKNDPSSSGNVQKYVSKLKFKTLKNVSDPKKDYS